MSNAEEKINKLLKALIVEDSEHDAKLLRRELRNQGWALDSLQVDNGADFRAALRDRDWDVILCDYGLPGFDALAALKICQEKNLETPFIILSGTVGEDVAVAAMRAGAHDYLMKDNLARLSPAIEREIADARVRRENRRGEAELAKLEWMLEPSEERTGAEGQKPEAEYGDLVELNNARLILDAVEPDMLEDIVREFLDMLDTSCAVYERNGDYALGIFSSGWCRTLDSASRCLCHTDDNEQALKCGLWHCHETCWQCARQAMDTGEPVDEPCVGGINLYTVPIRAGDDIIGAVNFGYGNPPSDLETLEKIAAKYGLDIEELSREAHAYESRPPFIIKLAKRRIQTAARLIGEMVERRRFASRLFDSQEFVTSILNGLSSSIAVLDKDGTMLTVNEAWRDFAKENGAHCEDAMEGVNYLDVCDRAEGISTEGAKEFAEGIRNVLDGKKGIFTMEYPCHSPDEQRWFIGRITPMQTADGIKAIVAHENITREVELEAQLRQSQKMEAIGKLAGGVAHDFNNLLQVILGYGELAIEDAKGNPEQHARIGEMLKASRRAKTLTSQMLAFSRQQMLKLQDVDINHVVTDLIKMLRHLIGEHITLDFLAGENLHAVRADAQQIGTIITNLCVNSRDAMMPQGGKITVSTSNVRLDSAFCGEHSWARPGEYVKLEVEDNGCGMAKEVLGRAFDPFFTTKEVGKGTGMGLSTVYGLVKQHNGLINMDSKCGKGTSCQIYFPASQTAQIAVEPNEATSGSDGNATILLAEDEEIVRNYLSAVLKRAGYTVHAAADGQEAVEIFRENSDTIELALLDVVMPRMGGHEVYKAIMNIRPELPVLFCTGYNIDAIHTNFVAEEDLEYIQKPCRRGEILERVRQCLEGSR